MLETTPTVGMTVHLRTLWS